MSTSTIAASINTFLAQQNPNRGQAVYGGGTLPVDYNILAGAVPAGGNAVTGISGIAAGATDITLPAGQSGNAVIIDGDVSNSASTSGTDSYSILVGANGAVSVTDNNSGNSQSITGASYLVFDGAATTASGAYQRAYLLETGIWAQIASMYNAAFGRVPDFAGLEYNAIPAAKGLLDLHQTAGNFLSSGEFKALYPALLKPADNGGANDQAFISELYGQILHRTPTASEINFYIKAIQGTLTNSAGQAIPAADRAMLLVYFSLSPENQADISAANGGWLINPANGPVVIGALSQTTATSLLTSEVASGTVNTADFTGMPRDALISAGGVNIVGPDHLLGNTPTADPLVSAIVPNVTISLSTEFFVAVIAATGTTINGVSSGGSVIALGDIDPSTIGSGGTINLSGNYNWLQSGNTHTGVSVATVVNGWNTTDLIVSPEGNFPGRSFPAATLLANPDGYVVSGSTSNPVSGTTLAHTQPQAGTTWVNGVFGPDQVAVNVGALANDTVSAMVAAANAAYKVGNVSNENAFFFGQDPQGNTMVFYWRGDAGHTGSVQASDITGAIQLVGVSANSLTGTNFHL